MERKPGLGKLKYDKKRRTIVRVRPTIKEILSRWRWNTEIKIFLIAAYLTRKRDNAP